MAALTSRERVLMAVAHREPDRPPIQLYLTPEMHDRLLTHFGREPREALQVDFASVGVKYLGPVRRPQPGSHISHYDIFGVGYERVQNAVGGTYDEARDLALARLETMDDVARYPWPDPAAHDYDAIPEQIARARKTGKATTLGGAGIPDIINGVGRGRGMDRVLMDIATGDEVGTAIIDRRVNFYYQVMRRSMEVARGALDILCLGEDLGTQKGPTISPATFDRFFRPRLQCFFDLAHEFGAKVMLHSCGSTRLLLPRLIEMGLDILDAVQPEPEGMTPEALKRDFGDQLTFCGMLSTQRTLPYGTPETCRTEAERLVRVIGRGGGYIFAPAHCIQPDTPVDNVLAAYSVLVPGLWPASKVRHRSDE